jgi:hypothetical protein
MLSHFGKNAPSGTVRDRATHRQPSLTGSLVSAAEGQEENLQNTLTASFVHRGKMGPQPPKILLIASSREESLHK